jgi:hypothetical protein
VQPPPGRFGVTQHAEPYQRDDAGLLQPILGVTPTGRSAQVDELVIFRIVGRKIAEAWEVYDECGMWRQLGTPPPG